MQEGLQEPPNVPAANVPLAQDDVSGFRKEMNQHVNVP